MYIPKNYQVRDTSEAIAFMQKYSFATIVSISENHLPFATHLPLTIYTESNKVILGGHFAKANEQWRNIDESTLLVIFHEPHAYISPSAYDKKESVPTWNYFAVHAYGVCKLIEDEQQVFSMLNDMIVNYEPDYKKQWDATSEEYKKRMIKGIVAFKINVTDIQASQKLSQNKTTEERSRIIEKLSKSEKSTEVDIANYMRSQLDR